MWLYQNVLFAVWSLTKEKANVSVNFEVYFAAFSYFLLFDHFDHLMPVIVMKR